MQPHGGDMRTHPGLVPTGRNDVQLQPVHGRPDLPSGNTCCTGAPACGGRKRRRRRGVQRLEGAGRRGRRLDAHLQLRGLAHLHVVEAAQCPNAAAGPGVCKSALTCIERDLQQRVRDRPRQRRRGQISCGCATGQVCSTNNAASLAPASATHRPGTPYNCANVPNGPAQPGGDTCGSFNERVRRHDSLRVHRRPRLQHDGEPNVCCAPAVCPAQALGSQCGAVTNGCATVNALARTAPATRTSSARPAHAVRQGHVPRTYGPAARLSGGFRTAAADGGHHDRRTLIATFSTTLALLSLTQGCGSDAEAPKGEDGGSGLLRRVRQHRWRRGLLRRFRGLRDRIEEAEKVPLDMVIGLDTSFSGIRRQVGRTSARR